MAFTIACNKTSNMIHYFWWAPCDTVIVLQHFPLDVYVNEKLKTNIHRHSQYVLLLASLKTFLGKQNLVGQNLD